MNHDCFKFIDKAVRKGRAHYDCLVCGEDVSTMWFFYQQAIDDLAAAGENEGVE